jgi:hypothetical protein
MSIEEVDPASADDLKRSRWFERVAGSPSVPHCTYTRASRSRVTSEPLRGCESFDYGGVHQETDLSERFAITGTVRARQGPLLSRVWSTALAMALAVGARRCTDSSDAPDVGVIYDTIAGVERVISTGRGVWADAGGAWRLNEAGGMAIGDLEPC